MKKPTIGNLVTGCALGLCVCFMIVISDTKEELKTVNDEKAALQLELAEYQADEAEIYPCPFCGSKDVHIVDMFGNGTDCYVKCEDCLGNGPAKNPNTDNWNMSKAEAIEWWNHNARE